MPVSPLTTALVVTASIAGRAVALAPNETAPAAETTPVRVFLLAGQSNMEGKGAVNTLPWVGEDPIYGHLLEDVRVGDNAWRERDDVWIDFLGRRGPLTVGYGSAGGPHGARIGPEYGFGMVVGDASDAPVLLIKTAWGGKDVAHDFRAPGSGGPGPSYTEMVERTRDVLARSGELFPALEGRSCVLAGFVWFQGWNDMVDKEKTAAYAENLAQMIRDLRRDLGVPDLPVVIGELGVGGQGASAGIAAFRAQQRRTAELVEGVRIVSTAPFWDEHADELYRQDVWKGPEKERFYRIASDRPYHYLGSGRIFYLIGHALGTEMMSMLGRGAVRRPHVLWITIDDCGPDFSCYGNTRIDTPNLDRLAARGQRFTRAFVTTPVCSPSRSGLITGAMPPAIGQHHHRSRQPLPVGVEPVTALFRAAGYRCTALPAQRVPLAEFVDGRAAEVSDGFETMTGRLKLDFNFVRDAHAGMFDAWDPASDAPFFAMIDFNPQKGPARFVQRYAQERGTRVDPAEVELEPYWPDTDAMRRRAARYEEALTVLDDEIGRVLDWLERSGLRDDTLVVVWGDHGRAAFRHKQWCYDSGLQVPLLIAGPGVRPGVREDLVTSLDLAPTALAACGIGVPATMSGRDLLDADAVPPRMIYAHRDRCDETEERVRTVRDERYRLVHNLRADLAWAGRNDYTRSAFLEVPILLDAREQGTLTDVQSIWLAPTKPEWELYDLERDPGELHNRWDDPELALEFARLRSALEAWEARVDARNSYPEALETIVPAKARRAVERLRGAG